MKIQIITLWSADNYGAYFQAFALKTYLQTIYPDAAISFLGATKEKRHLLSWVSKNLKKSRYQFLLQREFKKARNEFNISALTDTNDVCVIGADEVWNVNNSYFSHIEAYVGRGIKAKKCITYAPSANGATKDQFITIYGEEPFSAIDAISVRDKITQKLVREITSVNPLIVLDPTFLIDSYRDVASELYYTDYLFVYGYSFTNKEKEAIKCFAKEKKLSIISAGAYQDWTDIQIPASPKQFLGLVKNAEYIVTSTFHGTVFSILFNKEFISYARNNAKIIEILDAFNLGNRNSTDMVRINKLFDNKIDYTLVNKIINEKKDISTCFLQSGVTIND